MKSNKSTHIMSYDTDIMLSKPSLCVLDAAGGVINIIPSCILGHLTRDAVNESTLVSLSSITVFDTRVVNAIPNYIVRHLARAIVDDYAVASLPSTLFLDSTGGIINTIPSYIARNLARDIVNDSIIAFLPSTPIFNWWMC